MRPMLTVRILCAAALSGAITTVGAQQNNDVSSYQQGIDAIERDGGALDHRLSEKFLSLGLAHRANGDLDAALDAFRQALHVNRINKGLHHLVHVPIVDLLIETYTSKGDWPSVEQQHRFRYWIHRREVDSHSDEFVTSAMTYAAWQTRAYNLDTGTAAFHKLREALAALETAQATVEISGGSADPRLIPILNAQAQARLNLAVYVTTTDEDIASGGQRVGDDFGDIIERRNLVIESFIRGKQALERVAGLTAERQLAREHGLALANLGDFELAFDRPQSASENYRRAYEKLKLAGLGAEELEREFGSPRQMKSFSVEPRPPSNINADDPPNAFVTASFRVTKSGRVRGVEVLKASPPDNTRIRREARETLRATRFRPSIGEGGPFEDTTTIRYVFPNVSI